MADNSQTTQDIRRELPWPDGKPIPWESQDPALRRIIRSLEEIFNEEDRANRARLLEPYEDK